MRDELKAYAPPSVIPEDGRVKIVLPASVDGDVASDVTVIDRLEDMFQRQEEFMQVLRDADKMPEWPIDITSKFGQRHIKEVNANMVAELFEAMYILKNRPHRFTDHTDVDFGHFKEELGDALAFFMELCIMAGISADELYEEYCRKNQIVKQRAQEGY